MLLFKKGLYIFWLLKKHRTSSRVVMNDIVMFKFKLK